MAHARINRLGGITMKKTKKMQHVEEYEFDNVYNSETDELYSVETETSLWYS